VVSHSLSHVGNEKTIFMIYNLVASARKPLIKDPADFLYQFSLCQTQFPNLFPVHPMQENHTSHGWLAPSGSPPLLKLQQKHASAGNGLCDTSIVNSVTLFSIMWLNGRVTISPAVT
jgi:hypothetical protein